MPSHRFLVTAGNTRERIDAVRDWGNIFTGNTGFAIAKAMAARGEVDLLTSNHTHIAEAEKIAATIHASSFRTHDELRGSLAALMSRNRYDAIFMTAAVSDYRPQRVYAVLDRRADPTRPGEEIWAVRDAQAEKVKSSHPLITVLGEPTEKLVDLFRGEWKHQGLLVKFKLEVGISTEALLAIGQASREASGADYLVANTLEMVQGANPGAFLLSADGHEWIAREHLADRMARLV